MKRLLSGSGAGVGLALFSCTLLAAPVQDMPGIFVKWSAYLFLLFAIVVALLVYFLGFREDRRAAPLDRLLAGRKALHRVGPDTPVIACVRTMTAEKIGALLVMEDDRLTGIFTERDALNRVLATGRDPASTRVGDVMTKDPYCVAPTVTVSAAMELISERRFRHLPVVQDDKVVGLLSSGDLTHWLVSDRAGHAEGYVPLTARVP